MPRNCTVTKIRTDGNGITTAAYSWPAIPGDPDAVPPVPAQEAGDSVVIVEPPHGANFERAFAGAPAVKIDVSGSPITVTEVHR